MRKINGWENIDAQRFGEFEGIEPGWYPCVILNVAEEASKNSQRDGVRFDFDIVDGKFKSYYTRLYKADAGKDNRRWRGTYWQMTEGNGVPFFKGIITAIEESNAGYKFDFDERKMKGLKVGVGFRREQYEATDGTLKFTVKPFAFCSIQKVISGEMAVPKDKLLNIPASRPSSAPSYYDTPAVGAAPAYEALGDDEQLPF